MGNRAGKWEIDIPETRSTKIIRLQKKDKTSSFSRNLALKKTATLNSIEIISIFGIVDQTAMQKVIEDNKEALKKLCQKYDVQTMYVFGSASSIDFDDDSDIDILVSFKDITIDQYTDNYFDLHYELERLFNRKIDLLTENSLSNPYLKQSIEKTKKLLYAA